MITDRPTAIVANSSFYVGPALARTLSAKGYDLVLGDPDVALVDEIQTGGTSVAVVDGAADLAEPTAAPRLAEAAMETYGRLDSAVFFSGEIVIGRFLNSSPDDLAKVMRGNIEAVYRSLRAFLPPMVEAGAGQVLAITSASGLRVTPGAPLYSATRAGANMLVKNAAAEAAPTGVQVNSVGTNFMDFPGFIAATGADDPAVREKIESQVPMHRLGTMDEFAAFCSAFLDGSSRFQTGQCIGYDGGWSA